MARISAIALCATILAFAVLSATADDVTPDARRARAIVPKQWVKSGIRVKTANDRVGKLYLAKVDYNKNDTRCQGTVKANCFTTTWIVTRGKRADKVTVPVKNIKHQAANGRKLLQGCDILNLEVGPVAFNLLGLDVNLPNDLVLDVTGQVGQGQLLGNLLCQVASLLDGPLTGLLDNLLGQVTGLLVNLLTTLLGALLGPLLGPLLGGLLGGLGH